MLAFTVGLVLGSAFAPCASAADPDDPIGDVDDDIDIDLPSAPAPKPKSDGFGLDKTDKLTLTVDEDEGMKDFVAEAKKKAPPPVWFHLDLAGKIPLRDQFDVQITAMNDTFVVVELPVLVATSRAAFVAEHPGGITVSAEITSGSLKRTVTESFGADAVFDGLPTLCFLKTALPTAAKQGEVRFLVRMTELPVPPPAPVKGQPPAPPAQPATPKDLFARTTVFVRQ